MSISGFEQDRIGRRDSILEEIEEIIDDKTKKKWPNDANNINDVDK